MIQVGDDGCSDQDDRSGGDKWSHSRESSDFLAIVMGVRKRGIKDNFNVLGPKKERDERSLRGENSKWNGLSEKAQKSISAILSVMFLLNIQLQVLSCLLDM